MKKDKPDKLSELVAGIDVTVLAGTLAKDKFVQFRATEEEKKSLKQTADSLNLSVSEYILKLHHLVSAKLKKAGK